MSNLPKIAKIMKKTFTLFFSLFMVWGANSQTTVYTTGQSYSDAWTGWSAPVTTGTSGQSINGAYIYTFSGMSGNNFSVEITRQFTIYTNDMDIYLAATTENATVSVEFSTDNVTYTSIGSQNWGAGFSLSTLIIPAYNPAASTFYLKLKMTGTFGTSGQTNFNNLKIDAVVTGTASTEEFSLGKSVFYKHGLLEINTSLQNYDVAIFDINGRLITAEKNLKSFSFEGRNPGIYFVSIAHEGERKTIKISHVN